MPATELGPEALVVGAPVASKGAPHPFSGPASNLLERELKKAVKEQGLVIWLDVEGQYSAFVDGLRERAADGPFPYPVHRFEGSFLELMLRLEPHGNDLQPDYVLVHMPGFNEEAIAESPMYELRRAGKRFQKALDTLLADAAVGIVRPDELKEFLGREKPTLEAADAWLQRALSSGQGRFLIGIEACSLQALYHDLVVKESRLNEDLGAAEHVHQLVEHLARELGLPAEPWAALLLDRPRSALSQGDLAYFMAAWVMAVEFADDLREPTTSPGLAPTRELTAGLIAACRDLAKYLRQYSPEEYRLYTARLEAKLKEELKSHQPSALGSIDTFEFEECSVREAALSALREGNWEAALAFARERHPEACFWVRSNAKLERTWKLMTLAAKVGLALEAQKRGLEGCASLEEATHRYRDQLYKADREHRRFEQEFHRMQASEVEDEASLREAREALRLRYRTWADALGERFHKLCVDHGPLPSAGYRQREIFEQCVHPVVKSGVRVAYFTVDAMRFEMAAELQELFEKRKYRTKLQARLAELPTITEVGMNVLAPVSQQGRLRAVVKQRAFKGFTMGEKYTVYDPETRARHG